VALKDARERDKMPRLHRIQSLSRSLTYLGGRYDNARARIIGPAIIRVNRRHIFWDRKKYSYMRIEIFIAKLTRRSGGWGDEQTSCRNLKKKEGGEATYQKRALRGMSPTSNRRRN